MFQRHASSRLVAALLVAGVLAACGPADGPGGPGAPDPVLDRGLGPEPETLDPQLARTVQAHIVLRDLFEGLAGYSPGGELVPAAAESWAVSADGLSYTFRLRPEARWSNGEPVTAEDFVFAFRRLVDPETAAFYAETLIAVQNASAIVEGRLPPANLGARAVGTHELEIVLERPTPYFLNLVAHPATFPVNPRSRAAHGDEFARPGTLVSNGAYTLGAWELGSVITLERNAHYWNDDATAIDTVRHHVTEEPNAELYRYRAGELDVTGTIPADAISTLREQRPDELRIAPFLGIYYYGFNLNHPELGAKPGLRQALSMAIDRDVLTRNVTGRGEEPAWSWVPPGVANYEPRRLRYADLSREERLARARRLYEQAGYGPDNPLDIEIRYNTSETHQRIAVAIQAMWREALGFEATLINEEFRVLVANMRAMSITEIFRSAWMGDYNDAYTFLSIFESDNPSNMFGYRNEDYDSLLERAERQTDLGNRRLFLEEAERELLDDHPVIPIYYYVSKHLVSPRIRGWQDNVLDYHYSQHLSFDAAR